MDLSLFGTFLGADFTYEPGLTWDVLSQPGPSVPGQGSKYFDLEYLGIGQHVTLRDPAALATLAAVIQALEGSYQAVDPAARTRWPTLTALKFDGSSGWLFGAKFSALETVTLSAVFNDPVLYGLRLALDGKRAGVLAGLEFEILYRKISDSLGVFHIELKLPDSLRKIQAGEADITLPIIDLDVYTNGDFLVDLGFPHNLDFSRSFQIDMIVWAGPVPLPVSAAAGLYFGVLYGQTRQPGAAGQQRQLRPGHRGGVRRPGRARQVGVDRAARRGLLRRVHRHPGGRPGLVPPGRRPRAIQSVYYKVTGTVGIQIHIWGTVNFVDPPGQPGHRRLRDRHRDRRELPADRGRLRGRDLASRCRSRCCSSPSRCRSARRSASPSRSGRRHRRPWVVAGAGSLLLRPRPRPGSSSPPAASCARTGGVVQASPVFAHVLAERDQLARARPGAAPRPRQPRADPRRLPAADADRGDWLATARASRWGPQPQPQLVATLFVADRGQLEGALAVANADLPLTAGLTLTAHRTASRRHQRTATRSGSLAGTIPAAPDVFSLGFLTRPVPGLLPAGHGDHPARRDGDARRRRLHRAGRARYAVLDRRAAALARSSSSPARRCCGRWSPRSSACSRRRPRSAPRPPMPRPARAGHGGVGEPPARALRRPDQPRHAVLAVPGDRLPDQPGDHLRPAPDAGPPRRTRRSPCSRCRRSCS